MTKKLVNYLTTLIISIYSYIFILPHHAFAQTKTELGPFKGLGAYQKSDIANKDVSTASTALADIFSNVIGFLTIIAGLFFIIYFMIGGINWIFAGGKQERLQKAQDMMTNAAIGLVIVVAAYAIAFIASKVLDIDFLNLGEVIKGLKAGS